MSDVSVSKPISGSEATGIPMLGALLAGTPGCGGRQSALVTASREAERVADLFWWMTGVGTLIWLFVVVLAIYAIRAEKEHSDRAASFLIVGGGAVFPTVLLAVLLGFGLHLMPDLLRPAPQGGLEVRVSGEQWWWRVEYRPPGGAAVELANEIRLPVGQRVNFYLESPDVIHSFWIPALGGKMDMIPGRVNRLSLEPTRVGELRGVCTEFCGTGHALMAFEAVVMEPAAFDEWLARQAEPASPPSDELSSRGREVFSATGCGACHAVRGTEADGVIGPDLTHVASRRSLGAGVLPNDRDALRRWLAETERVKPGVHMPGFGMLPEPELRALVAYLDGLE